MQQEEILKITIPTPYAVGDVHAYLVKGEALTLFDAGVRTADAWDALTSQLKAADIDHRDIDQVVLSHHHPDHTGLIQNFYNVQHIYGHPLVNKWISRDKTFLDSYITFFHTLYDQFDVPESFRKIEKSQENVLRFSGEGELTGTLQEGAYIPGLNNWKVLETPGHAQSHLSFYNEKSQQLIAGDHLLAHISSNPILEAPETLGEERPKPLISYIDSMKKLLPYEISEILPGHGETFNGHSVLIKKRLQKQSERARHVHQFLKKNQATPFTICKFLFPKHYEKQFGLTMSETVGQLDFLEDQGFVNKVTFEGKIYYEAVRELSNLT
ncbi:MBL fold metallo-hydrolase [Halalkalibacillus halophilus]|uniref:MBL fold metallo-hydrolase n=1 Tax=Halalkalibacillus halophilus TaxID=392827 RepID=UPI000418E7C2|nr:MBL fold metallo-hydrolase [Halalkalibacillus halophilus]